MLPRRIGLLSVGNVLMGDDGVGAFLLKLLEARYIFPECVVLEDLGTPGLGITSFFADYDSVILLDAVKASGNPGDVRVYRKDEIMRVKIPPRISPHDPALVESLLFAELSGKCPQTVTLIGIIPENCDLGCRVSDSVRNNLEAAISATISELRQLGIEATPRADRKAPNIWWEEATTDAQTLEEGEHVPGHSR